MDEDIQKILVDNLSNLYVRGTERSLLDIPDDEFGEGITAEYIIEIKPEDFDNPSDYVIALSNQIAAAYKEEAKKNGPAAHWDISLYVDCPNCNEYVDLTRGDDFWTDRPISDPPLMDQDNFPALCPECGHEFLCDVYW